MNAIMTDFDFKQGSLPLSQEWQGLAELDRAIAEDRLTAYRLKKAWADPVGRAVFWALLGLIAAIWIFLIGAALGFW